MLCQSDVTLQEDGLEKVTKLNKEVMARLL